MWIARGTWHRRRGAAALVALVATTVVACGDGEHFSSVDDAIVHYGANPAAALQLDEDRALIVVPSDMAVELWAIADDGGGWTRQLIVQRDSAGSELTVFLVAITDSPTWTGSYAFGTAPDGVASVTIDADGTRGGQVVDRAWVIATDEQLPAATFSWRMLGAAGEPVTVGIGEVPPQP
jgi:hypothetical protein